MTDTNTLAPTDAEILTLLPTVKLKDEDPKRMVWLTRKDALKFVRVVLAKFGAPAPASQPVAATAGMEPVASKSHGAWDGIEDVLAMPDGTDIYTAAQVQAMGRVPPGWQAVPVEDTPSMWTAGGRAIKNCGGHERDAASLAYKAMLAAAPAQPMAWPKDAADVREFMTSNCEAQEYANDDKSPSDDDRYQLSAHDFLSAVVLWADFPHYREAVQAQEDAQDAARYRFLRDGEWRRTDLESVIRLQLSALWDAKIDAAIAAQQGTTP